MFLFDRIIKNIRQYNKVSTGSIKHIELIHSGDIIFYDSKEQVGIVNSTNL